jgi:aminopeptidase N
MRNSFHLCLFCSVILILFNGSLLAGIVAAPGNAAETGQNYNVGFYFLDLNVSDTSTYIQGHAAVYLTLQETGVRQIALDFYHLLVADSVQVNHRHATCAHTGDLLNVDIPVAVQPDSNVIVDVFYHGLGKSAGDVPGIYNKVNAALNKTVTWTLSESFHALSWFPCKQSLTDKADSVYVFLSMDKSLKAGSNGLLTASIDLPGNRVRYEWKCRYPIDYYLISFAVSDYRDYSFFARKDNSDSLLIQNYIYNSDTYFEQNKALIDKTADLIRMYSDLYGEYPFHAEKYGHCVAPSGGGMEHQTMTTLVNFSFLLVAHELAHQWFGDYVTCKTWQDIWINEGFASYSEYLADEKLISKTEADNWMVRTQDYVRTLPAGSIYVPDASMNDEDRIFDFRLTYSKGAVIIHMIRQEVGDDNLFFSICREFLNRYKHGTASGSDFRNILTEMTGHNFDQFFEQWYYGEGYPTQAFNWYHQHDTLYVRSLQTTSASTPLFNILIEYQVTVNNRDSVISHRQESGLDNWHVYLPGDVTSVKIDPKHWLLMEVAGISQTNIIDENSHFVLTPNPARDKINLRFAEPVHPYSVYLADSAGKIMFSDEAKNADTTIDVSHLSKGMYLIIVDQNNVIYQTKFIKN